jgi:hypothetical protein
MTSMVLGLSTEQKDILVTILIKLIKIRMIKSKSKAISVTVRGDLCGCEMLRIRHCLDNRLTDGGKVVSRSLLPTNIIIFLHLVLISVRS